MRAKDSDTKTNQIEGCDRMLNENMHQKANRLVSMGRRSFCKAKAEDKPIFLSIGYS